MKAVTQREVNTQVTFSFRVFVKLEELELELLWPHEIWGWEKSPDGEGNRLQPQCKGELEITLFLLTLPAHPPSHVLILFSCTHLPGDYRKQGKQTNKTPWKIIYLRALPISQWLEGFSCPIAIRSHRFFSHGLQLEFTVSGWSWMTQAQNSV